MPKKRFPFEGIIGTLRHADVRLGWGEPLAEVVKDLDAPTTADGRSTTGSRWHRCRGLE